MNTKFRLYKIFVAGMLFVSAVLLCLFGKAIGGFWIAFLLSFVLIVPAIYILKSLPADTKEYEDLLQKTNSLYIEMYCIHKEGLQGVGNESCNICVRNDDIMIQSKDREYSLPYHKIFNCIFTQEYKIVQDIQTKVKTKGNLGKAALGGALFGVTGAIVGAAAKPKTEVETNITNKEVPDKQFIVVTYYNKDDNLTSLTFEGMQFNQLRKLEKEINQRIPKEESILEEKKKIEL